MFQLFMNQSLVNECDNFGNGIHHWFVIIVEKDHMITMFNSRGLKDNEAYYKQLAKYFPRNFICETNYERVQGSNNFCGQFTLHFLISQ